MIRRRDRHFRTVRRMKTLLKMLVAAGPAVSLGLCLATLLLWLRSYEAYPAAALATGARTWHAGSRRGNSG
jgi:hypothetical protein